MDIAEVLRIYQGSNGDTTRALYAELETKGPIGTIAVNLFRACKTSERAKQYRGGGYRGKAYDTKQWAMGNLCSALTAHGEALGIGWGWGVDEKQEYHRHVLYVDLPTGQVSFHTASRGTGPDYPRSWDGVKNVSADRICRFAARVLKPQSAQA